MMFYRNKSNGAVYRWLAGAVDMTQSSIGRAMAVYCPNDNEHTIYVRDEAEFNEQFELITQENA